MKKKVLSVGKDYTYTLPNFRELILECDIPEQGNLIFAGCPGPCYSMATFFGFAIRDLNLNQYFAVNSDMNQLWRLEYKDNLGVVATSKVDALKGNVIVLMSGLLRIPIENTLDLIKNALVDEGIIIGEAPAPGLFEKEGWDKEIRFRYLFEFSMKDPTASKIQ